MNAVLECIKNRRGYKAYKDTPVPKELLEQIAEAGSWAPSGMNAQSPIIVVITNKELRDRISRLNAAVLGEDEDEFYGAPAVLVVLAKRSVRTAIYDGSLVAENMMLAAESLGLGSCWIHRAKEVFDTEEGRQILADVGVTGEYEGIANIIVGYPSAPKNAPARKPDYIYWAE